MRTFYSALFWLAMALAGSGRLLAKSPVPTATARLATLARVWGVLKYHHSRVAQGAVDWDSVLVAAVPRVQAARTAAAYEQALLALCAAVGPVTPGAGRRAGPPLPAAEWVRHSPQLGPVVRARLLTVLDHYTPQENKYVTNKYQNQDVGQPLFPGENAYAAMAYPGSSYRLLALFRLWNAIENFYPYKSLTGRPWDRVLTDYIPQFAQAPDTLAYHRMVEKLVTELHDSHGAVSSRVLSRELGWHQPPFQVQQLGRQTVVSQLLSDSLAARYNVRVGDVISKVNGVPIRQLRGRYRLHISASTPGALMRDANLWALRGSKGSQAALELRRGKTVISTIIPRFRYADLQYGKRYGNQPTAAAPAWQWLTRRVGYLHLGRLAPAQVDTALAALHTADALVFDVRNYPAWPMPYRLIPHLYPSTEAFIAFAQADLSYPGTWFPVRDPNPRASVSPARYHGRVFILVDENTQSLAEMTVMALQQYPGAVTIGSPTAGANGNVTSLVLPGNITVSFTGLGAHYPTGTPTQRRGVKLDVVLRPTAAGLRAGRDELVERALELAQPPLSPKPLAGF